MSVRQERVASLIRQEISQIVQRSFTMAEAGFVTVTDVVMSPDLKIAKVYLSIFGDDERKQKTLSILEENKSQIRAMLGSRVRLKYTPALSFFIDATLDHALRIDRLISELRRESDGHKQED